MKLKEKSFRGREKDLCGERKGTRLKVPQLLTVYGTKVKVPRKPRSGYISEEQ